MSINAITIKNVQGSGGTQAVQQAQQQVDNCFAGYNKASGAADASGKASDVAAQQVEVTGASLKSSSAAVDTAKTGLEGAKIALENAQKSGDKDAIAAAEGKVAKAQANLDTATKQMEDAKKANDTASADAKTAAQKSGADKEQVTSAKADLGKAQNDLAQVKTNSANAETQPNTASNATKTGGIQETVTHDGNTTTTVKDNSPEFKAQEKENIVFADTLKRQYAGTNDLDAENSLKNDKTSSRTLQRKGLASVEYTPALTENIGKSEKYMDSVDAAKNKDNCATSVIRNREQAVDYYLEKTGAQKNANGGYEPADRYAAEYAVSALQPAIVKNAKDAEAYQTKFASGNATTADRNDAIDKLKNGAVFNDGAKPETASATKDDSIVRTASDELSGHDGQLLTDTEKSALIDKLNSGKSNFTQRELNALTYLQGTTDVQGFPTVPSDMEWNLPTSFKKIDQVMDANAETYVCNFDTNGAGGNNVKVLVEKDSDAYKIFAEGIAKKHSDVMVGSDGTSAGNNSSSTNSNIDEMTSNYSVGNVKWQDLTKLAGSDGKLTAKELVDAGYMDKGVLKTLKNPDQEYEIQDLGDFSAVYSAEKMTDGDNSTGMTNIVAGLKSEISQNGGYAISGGNALSFDSMQSVKNSGVTVGEFSYYDTGADGKPEVKTVTISGSDARDNLAGLKKTAQANYKYFHNKGQL